LLHKLVQARVEEEINARKSEDGDIDFTDEIIDSDDNDEQ